MLGTITWQALMDPKFINASSISLLQRLKAVQTKYTYTGGECQCRVYLYSPWIIDPQDDLASLISSNDGRLIWPKLAEGKTDRSGTGRIRAVWSEHLNIKTDEELKAILQPFRIEVGPTLSSLRDRLNDKLSCAGLKPIHDESLCHPYEDLCRKFVTIGKKSFSRSDIEDICKREGLWNGTPISDPDAIRIGIRSFMLFAENLEDETDELLSLCGAFNGRQIRSLELWQKEVFPNLYQFLSKSLKRGKKYHLHLQVHSSIAFATGYCVPSKAGIEAVPVQYISSGLFIWRPDPLLRSESYPKWNFHEEKLSDTGPDIALALSARHDIVDDVKVYVKKAIPQVHKIISCCPPGGPAESSVLDGSHAKLIAQEIETYLRSNRSSHQPQGKVHFFTAAPNSLLFFLGQIARSFGRCVLYEYDFESACVGAYQPSLSLPPDEDTYNIKACDA